jgi:hypothetical protein
VVCGQLRIAVTPFLCGALAAVVPSVAHFHSPPNSFTPRQHNTGVIQ